jgi:hypothetical protein
MKSRAIQKNVDSSTERSESSTILRCSIVTVSSLEDGSWTCGTIRCATCDQLRISSETRPIQGQIPWPELWSLFSYAERYRSSLSCCQNDRAVDALTNPMDALNSPPSKSNDANGERLAP